MLTPEQEKESRHKSIHLLIDKDMAVEGMTKPCPICGYDKQEKGGVLA